MEFLLLVEGEWSTDRLTRWGIDVRHHPEVDLEHLTPEARDAFYYENYWVPLRCAKLPEGLDLVVFDWGVNSGAPTAARRLQAALGVHVDGRIGPVTLAAAQAADRKALIVELCQRRARDRIWQGATQEGRVNLAGWVNRIIAVAVEGQAAA